MVGQSDAADTGESDLLLELVSDRCGEYRRCIGVLAAPPPPLLIDWTRLALFATTLAVLMIGEVRVGTEVATRLSSNFKPAATAVDG